MQISQDPRDSLSAASAAAKVPTPISTWTLDGTGGFNDSGPAAVNMTIVGSWTDLTTGSLVSGVGGTSACNAGTGAYATLPASQAAHNLGALTLSFYYQRNSMAAKHVLFAIGDGTAIGDLSIEVLANGLLRGYHVGGDGGIALLRGHQWHHRRQVPGRNRSTHRCEPRRRRRPDLR